MIAIVYIFIVLVAAYIAVGFFRVPGYDILMIGLSLVVLVATMIRGHLSGKIVERFVSNDVDISTVDLKPIELEEDITEIKNRLVVYTTAFNKNSYNENGNAWLNLAVTKKDGTCDTENSNSVFNFELPPVYSRKSGFYFGNNRLVGPFCNAMNIQFHNTFTIVLACKHGNLLVDNTNNEIELLKLYANSPNNNGLSMYIQKNSLQNVNNVQMGNLMFQYSSRDPFQCKLNQNHEKISFEKDVLTFYFIIKDTDHIRVAMMTEKNTNVEQILRFAVENSDVTFSNKEFVLNRLKNWNGNVYTLAMYNSALSDDDITGVYSHVLSEYMKYVNPNFIGMIKQYNDTLALLQKFVSCPYDKGVCTACSTVNKWNSMEQVLGASADCKKAINEFCMANTNHTLCKCWNNQNAAYGSDSCKMFRGIFTDKNSFLDGLSQSDIDYIMSKYGLIRPSDCPKNITKPGFLKNSYGKYDYNKLKVYLDQEERVENVAKVYPDLVEGESIQAAEDDYDWDKLKIKYDEGARAPDSAREISRSDLRVGNFYKQDPDTNYKTTGNGMDEQYAKINRLAKEEVKKINDTKDLNIIPPASKKSDKIVSYYKDDVDPPKAAPTAQEASKPSTGTAGDSFFSRFMKISV